MEALVLCFLEPGYDMYASAQARACAVIRQEEDFIMRTHAID
jgi:hypothetical protein